MPAEQGRGALRRLWLTAHRWLGLAVAVFFIIASLTGAVLVYEHELDTWINGGVYHTTPGDVGAGAVLERAAQEVPGELVMLRWPTPREPQYVVEMRRDDGSIGTVRVDPGSGDLAQQRRVRIPVVQAIRRMHVTMFAGVVGHYVVLVASALALISLVTGLVLWWPGVRRFLRGFAVRTNRGFYPLNFDLHQVAGTVAMPFLFVITLTGILIPYQNQTERALGIVLGEAGAQASVPLADVAAVSAQPVDLIRTAQQIVPDGRPALLRMPAQEGQNARVEILRGPHGRAGGVVAVVFDPVSATVKSVRDPAAGSIASRMAGPINFNLHIGAVGGAWVRPAYVLLCITGAALALSGTLIWWLKRARINERDAARDASVNEPVMT